MRRWEQIKLGDSATFVNGYAFKPKDWNTTGKEIIRIQNLTGKGNDINFFEGEIPERYKVTKGDLLISWSATLGIFEWQKEDAWLNQHIFKVVFDKKEFDKIFFKYLISSVLNSFKQRVHGSTMKHITKGNFDNMIIPYPPLPEQKRIAAILDKADALRQKNNQLLAAYDELLHSVFLELFGDPVTNPKGWKKRNLGEFGNWKSGGTPSRSKKEYYEGDIPWLSSGELEKMYVAESNEYITEKAIDESAAKKIAVGSLLLGMYDTAALKSSINTKILACNQAIAFAKLDDKKINTLFVYTQIQKGKEFFRSKQRGVRQKNLNLSMIKSIELIYPPISLQNQFAQIVENIESQKVLVNQSLQESEDLFNGLVQKAFKREFTDNNEKS